jgi:hypothetical protein
MPAFVPISRRDPIVTLRRLGFDGPLAGSKHQLTTGRGVQIRIPRPHRGDVGPDLRVRRLRHPQISGDEWEAV